MNTPLAYLNGKLLPFAEAALPLHDAGFVSGATVVDNARTFRHKLFRWPDHLARFRRDCAACYVPLEATDVQLTATAEELVAHNAKLLPVGGELQLVTFATPGPLGFYLGDSANGPPTLGMTTYPLPFARYRPFFTDGATLAVAGLYHDWSIPFLRNVKHRSRILWHVVERQVRADFESPNIVPILTDGAGGPLSETAIACFLAVVAGDVISAPRAAILNSISLRVTQDLCGHLGIGFLEHPIHETDLNEVSEAMLTGTGFCLAGVRELLSDRAGPVRFTWPGPVFRRLLAAWSDLVGVDIEKQFTNV